MQIKSRIIFQPRNQEWPSILIQTFGSWQQAFKETQKLVNKTVRVRDAKLLSVIIEETEE